MISVTAGCCRFYIRRFLRKDELVEIRKILKRIVGNEAQ
jgi:hypothetical protein